MCIFFRRKFFFGLAFMLLTTSDVFAQQEPLFKETETQPGLIYLKPIENKKHNKHAQIGASIAKTKNQKRKTKTQQPPTKK